MDIWKWVNNIHADLINVGQNRLAYLLNEIPNQVNGSHYEYVDALIPEALALSKKNGNTWLEIFFRHWNLQSRLFSRYEPKNLLSEAVSLLEFSHREENQQCPQSICVVQDFVKCHALIDGPGYFSERINILNETFKRINSEWPCFFCLTGEYVDALCDNGDFNEALAFLDKQDSEFKLINNKGLQEELRYNYAVVCFNLRQYEKAHDYLKKSKFRNGYQKNFKEKKMILTALTLAKLKRFRESKQYLIKFDNIKKTHARFVFWSQTKFELVVNDIVPFDLALNNQFQYMVASLSDNGVIRKSINIALLHGELLLKNKDKSAFEKCCKYIESLIPKLREPNDVYDKLKSLRIKA
jgi:tetratricopeptide (TPR) repeat protein